MAVSAHIVYGKMKKGQPVLDASFTSATVLAGATSAAADPANNYMSITALEGSVWAAFNTGTPNAAANPRMFIPVNTTITVSYSGAIKVDIDTVV